ncbi:MAG TPA: VOC family protein [Castellaniella sp.]|uniref:VOC family protein n=1 Tax=Castellaniella sp. TaxID=1955812 RepID=UPI002F17C0BB
MTPRVMGLNGFGLEVPDLQEARRFYETFGLQAREEGDALLLRCPGRLNDEVVLIQGAKKRLHHVSFLVSPAALGVFADRLRAQGMAPTEASPVAGTRAGLWFKDPWGTRINLHPGELQPEPVVALPEYNLGGQIRRVDVNLWQALEPTRGRRPLRLGHILIFTPDWEKAERFFTEVLGLRPTDRIAGKGVFMNAGEGIVDHHCFALIQSSHRGLQHASFYVASFDDIGFGAWHMRESGYRELFGPGRHAIASNLFEYFRDPWGSWIEYYSDMDKVTSHWVCRDWRSLPYTWGPQWSPEFWSDEMNGNFEPEY